ncbi:MAG: hypothetical protein V3571_07840 [Pseudodesulfovibrio sp.]
MPTVISSMQGHWKAITTASALLCIFAVPSDSHILSFAVGTLLSIPIMDAMMNARKTTLRGYLRLLLSWKTANYALFLIVMALIPALLSGFPAMLIDNQIVMTILFSLTYAAIFPILGPYLYKTATNTKGRTPGIKSVGKTYLTIQFYSLADITMQTFNARNALIALLTMLAMSLFTILFWCTQSAILTLNEKEAT